MINDFENCPFHSEEDECNINYYQKYLKCVELLIRCIPYIRTIEQVLGRHSIVSRGDTKKLIEEIQEVI